MCELALDRPLACARESRALLTASLAPALVKNDDQGSVRLAKRDPANNTGRDDVAAVLVLARGALSRAPKPDAIGDRGSGALGPAGDGVAQALEQPLYASNALRQTALIAIESAHIRLQAPQKAEHAKKQHDDGYGVG